jgi:hypothetical protein
MFNGVLFEVRSAFLSIIKTTSFGFKGLCKMKYVPLSFPANYELDTGPDIIFINSYLRSWCASKQTKPPLSTVAYHFVDWKITRCWVDAIFYSYNKTQQIKCWNTETAFYVGYISSALCDVSDGMTAVYLRPKLFIHDLHRFRKLALLWTRRNLSIVISTICCYVCAN